GAVEAMHASADTTVTQTFAAQPLAVTHVDVQHGAAGRSFVRYVDLSFNKTGTALSNLISHGQVRLVQYNLDGTGGTTLALPAGVLNAYDHLIEFDFGAGGIGSLSGAPNADSTVGDGYYKIELDLDGSGNYATTVAFDRLLGDVDGNRSVDANDAALVSSQMG